MAETNIGYSSLYASSGIGSAGPRGATGATGTDQTTPGATGNPGLDSNYITEVQVNQTTGKIEFKLSDGTWRAPSPNSTLKGITGYFAGITAISVGGGIPVINGVCGGITLQFYNFRTDGLITTSIDSSGSLKFSINSNYNVGGVDSSSETNRIVYAKEKNYISSTDLIPKTSTFSNRSGNTSYGYIDFGGETAGRNVVTEIQETQKTVGPIYRNEKVLNSNFYEWTNEGIKLDLSQATVYRLVTPIGIKEFNTNSIGSIPNGQLFSVTLIIDGDDVWNFPTNVYFDEASRTNFYPGTNILHLSKDSQQNKWYAHFTAKGFDVNSVSNPGERGSCCYIVDTDQDGNAVYKCEEYFTEHNCNQLSGSFKVATSCEKHPCTLTGTPLNGVCCSEGFCLTDIDINLCDAINGYFVQGIQCGDYGSYPEADQDTNNERFCKSSCYPLKYCCKDGECLGEYTVPHCEGLLGGKSVVAQSCLTANCCDHIQESAACCIPTQNNDYTCQDVNSPFECKSINGVYMGRNSSCDVNTDICCTVQTTRTCYRCPNDQQNNGSPCNCTSFTVTGGAPCPAGTYENATQCDSNCNLGRYRKCEPGGICTEGWFCTQTGLWELGSCSSPPCPTSIERPCFRSCNCSSTPRSCQSLNIRLEQGETLETPCPELQNNPNPDVYLLNSCNCDVPDICGPNGGGGETPPLAAACFWCYPQPLINQPVITGTFGGYTASATAPYRSVVVVTQQYANQLESAADQPIISSSQGLGITWGDAAYAARSGWDANILQAVLSQYSPLRKDSLNTSFSLGAPAYKGLYYTETYDGYSNISDSSWDSGGFFNNPVVHYPVSTNGAFATKTTSEWYTPVGARMPPWAVKGQYYCSFVGSYGLTGVYVADTGFDFDQMTDEQKTENRNNCLDRFGYFTEELKERTTICDPVLELEPDQHVMLPLIGTMDGNELPDDAFCNINPEQQDCAGDNIYGTLRKYGLVKRIEPYQEIINKGVFAPFPPIWGRLSMWRAWSSCTQDGVQYGTGNLRLFDMEDSHRMTEYFRRTGKPGATASFLFWRDFVKQYPIPSNTISGSVTLEPNGSGGLTAITGPISYMRKMERALINQVPQYLNGCKSIIEGDAEDESCVCAENDASEDVTVIVTNQTTGRTYILTDPMCDPDDLPIIVSYDPFRMGGNKFPAAYHGFMKNKSFGHNQGPLPITQPCDFFDLPNPQGWVHFSAGAHGQALQDYYEIQGFDFKWLYPVRQTLFGKHREMYYTLLDPNPNGNPSRGCEGVNPNLYFMRAERGILGRNMRYNLPFLTSSIAKKFNTASVFFDVATPSIAHKFPTMFNATYQLKTEYGITVYPLEDPLNYYYFTEDAIVESQSWSGALLDSIVPIVVHKFNYVLFPEPTCSDPDSPNEILNRCPVKCCISNPPIKCCPGCAYCPSTNICCPEFEFAPGVCITPACFNCITDVINSECCSTVRGNGSSTGGDNGSDGGVGNDNDMGNSGSGPDGNMGGGMSLIAPSKIVKISEGVCVNMLCPECEDYEEC